MPVPSIGYGATSANSGMAPIRYEVRDPTEEEVLVEVAYCGICHSDIHTARSEWGESMYPCVPGHEFTGHVVKVGEKVTKHKVGDRVAIGCMVDSCKSCELCQKDLENYCGNITFTYGCPDRNGVVTKGGYGKYVVAHERFVCTVPEALPLDRTAPLLCAGITVYSPIVACGMNRGGYKVGVIGLGGLGHMAVQFAAKMGNEVVTLSRTAGKKELALSLGASHFITSDEEYAQHKESLDFIIDTVSAKKPMTKHLNLLKTDGTLVIVGVPPFVDFPTLDIYSLVARRRKIMGSVMGGLKETQEMLNYCAEHQILPIVEMIKCEDIPQAYERVVNSDVKFRFVIDVKNTQPAL